MQRNTTKKTTFIQSLRKFLKLTRPDLSDEQIEKKAESERRAALNPPKGTPKVNYSPIRHYPTAIKPFGTFTALRPFETPRKATPKTTDKAQKRRAHNLEKFKNHQNWLKVHAKPQVQG